MFDANQPADSPSKIRAPCWIVDDRQLHADGRERGTSS
jgi:hypothetical protein